MNPIMIDLGIVTIRWYSFFIFLALIVGGFLALKESEKWHISENFMINLAFYLIPLSIIGARLYFVLFHWDYYSQHLIEIPQIWNGGLAIHGGILFGFLFILIYSKKYKVHTLRLLDIIVVSLILGQAIGRWGNFFNGEAHGPATTLAFLKNLHLPQFIIDGMYIDGTYYHPTFLYESIWCLIGFVVLLFVRKRKYNKMGQVTAVYLMWYSVGRFFIEALRTDSFMFGNLKVAQIVSIVLAIIGFLLFFWSNRGSVFDNQYNDKHNLEDDSF